MDHPFQAYPSMHVRAAFRLALDAARYNDGLDIVTHAFGLCHRWQQCPWLPDVPPLNGKMELPPLHREREYHVRQTFQDVEPMMPVKEVIKRLPVLKK